MATRVFLEINGRQLISDERDIMVPAQHRQQVIQWCHDMGVKVESPGGNYSHALAEKMFGVNVWRVRDQQQRAWFGLRWS